MVVRMRPALWRALGELAAAPSRAAAVATVSARWQTVSARWQAALARSARAVRVHRRGGGAQPAWQRVRPVRQCVLASQQRARPSGDHAQS